MNSRTLRYLMVIAFSLLQACSNTPTQQASAYSVATGFLTLCDDNDFAHAVDRFAKPLGESPAGATFVEDMQNNRGQYGMPVLRALVSRNSQGPNSSSSRSDNMNFVFRTSFIDEAPGEESVSLTKVAGRWQVYDYKFHPSGKASGKAHGKATPYSEEQNDDNG